MITGGRIGIACVGCGYWGKNLVRNIHQMGMLVAICDESAKRQRDLLAQYPGVKVYGTFDDVLKDPAIDAVVLATPAELHARQAMQAIEAGKDVFVEKPLALTTDEAATLDQAATQNGRILMVGHLLWYHPAVLKLKEMIDGGELGRIQYIYSNRLNLGKIRREENILWSFAPHDVSVILGLVGEMPNAVEARGGNYLHDAISDVTVSFLSFPSGVRGHIFVSWLHPFKEQKLVVVGDRGMAVFDDLEPTAKLTIYRHSIAWRNGIPVPSRGSGEVVPVEPYEPLLAECEHFVACVAERRRPRTDAQEALRVLQVLQACQSGIPSDSDRRLRVGIFRPPAPARRYTAHESVSIDEDVEVGEGTTIWHFTRLLKGTRVGKGCRIGQNVVIGPDVSVGNGVKIQNNVSVYEGVALEDDVFCGPSMVFTNVYNPRSEIRKMDELRRTLVRKGATLGANCTIVCGVTIGRYAFVGAGAVVLRDVPDHALVVGNPGRIVGWMCVCGERIHFDDTDGAGHCAKCEKEYVKDGDVVAPTRTMAAV